MSWQTYVDEHLMCEIEGGNHLSAAAILGHDGSVWAQSATFPQIYAFMNTLHRDGDLSILRVSETFRGGGMLGNGRNRDSFCDETFAAHDILLTPDEFSGLMKEFDEPGTLAPTGMFIAGAKYMVLQGEQGAVIRGKKGPGGICVKKTGMALLIGIYEEPVTPGQCNMIVEKLGDYLIDSGM